MTTHTESSVCWRLVFPDGKEFDGGDGVRHFTNERDARDDAEDRDGKALPQSFATPCLTLTCDGCELDLESDMYTMHLRSVEDAHNVARECDWTVTKYGRAYCYDCPVPDEDDADLEAQPA